MKTIFTHSKKLFTITLIFLFASITVGYSQGSFDGNYCPAPGAGGEYNTGIVFSKQILASPSSTCQIGTVYAKVDLTPPNPTVRLGMNIGNGGSALFRLYLDTDKDSSSGITSDTFGGPLTVAGADYILEINSNGNGFTLYKGNNDNTKTVIPSNGLAAKSGNYSCSGGDSFIEFNIPLTGIGINICDPNNPGEINLAKLASVSGNSENSSRCTDTQLSFGIPLRGTVEPSISTVCSGINSTNLTVTGIAGTYEIIKWQSSPNNDPNEPTWADIPGTENLNLTTYTVNNLSTTTLFRAIFKSSGLCSGGEIPTSSAIINVNQKPTATISYLDSPWCTTATAKSVTLTGTGAYTGGVYSSTTGLTINASTGTITPSTSNPGTYTVTYTIPASAPCPAVTATTSVTITALPTANISYSGSPWCTSTTPKSVTLAGTGTYTGGVYSSTAGLTINASTGEITPSTSTAGTYTVTYTIAAADGCAAVTATTQVTITTLPTASISYTGSPWCTSDTVKSVTLTGSGVYTGGVYSSTTGLTINASTGEITPSTSTAGTYTVTYTLAAAGGCAAVTATTQITITTLPTASISYTGSPWCTSETTKTVTLTGTGIYTGGVYSSTPGLTINASTGTITPSTSSAGTYTVTYTIAAAGGCAAVTATTQVTITTLPTASISYTGSPWCTSATAKTVTLTGTGIYTGGVYSSTPGLTINASTGTITPSTSTAGTYTVTYTIAASGGCAAVTATTQVTITTLPTANISYTGSPWCTSESAKSVTLTGSGIYTGGVYSSTAGLSINTSTGEITPSTSSAGTYTVTYTIAAAGGCAAVTATTQVTITTLPTASISYTGSPWCTSASTKTVTLTGTGIYTGGVYSSTPGLTINASTGTITPSTSTAGTYTVTYTIAASGGCAAVTATTQVTITTLPTASISYTGSPWCTSESAKSVTLTGSGIYTGGVYSSTAGLTINASTGEITPSTSSAGTYTVTYTIAAAGGCAAVTATTQVTITTLPTASISYLGSPWCTSATAKTVTLTGTGIYTGGVYSSTPGLTINASTGTITPSTSTAGTYTVTYTIAAASGCAAVTATTSVTITALPTASISYSGSPWCTSETAKSVTLTGTGIYTGGVYSSMAGLTINASTGEITPSTSSAGTYTVTYTIAAAGGCAAVTATTQVTITTLPTANISYTGSPWCTSATTKTVTLTGTGIYTGGVYSSTPGLTINASTGTITPSTSSAGTYTVTYTIAAAGGCAAVTATTQVTITTLPTANISYSGSPWCTSETAKSVTLTGTGIYTGGVYSSTAGLTINASTGEITPSTSSAGTYTVTYTIAAAGGCAAVTATTQVTITTLPTASISYTGSPWCTSTTPKTVTLTGTGIYTGGVYSSTPGLTINASTGTITPSTSSAGTYTVTYTIAAAGGCAAVTATTSVTITTLPTANISYSGSPWCTSETAKSVTLTGTGIYTGGVYSSTAGLTINASTGEITPSTSTAGTYTVTYTIAAAAGCAVVTATTSVTINSLPSSPISGGPITECKNETIQTLTAVATVPAGQHIVWYNSETGGQIVQNPTLNTVGTVTYYAEAVNNSTNCISSSRTAVKLTINSCSIKITKDGTYQDTNGDGITNIGDNIIYNFVVTNTSNVTLTNITITDSNATISGGPIASLAAGASDNSTFTGIHVITQNDINSGIVYNLATVTGTSPTGDTIRDTSTDPTPCTSCPKDPECLDCTITTLDQSPSINVTKDGTYVDSNQDGITNLGDVVTYNFVVKNTGNVTLTNVTITDNNAVITGGPIVTLAVGATDSITFTGSHAITQEEINAGLVYNLATVVAKDPKNNDVTDTSSDPTPCTSCPKDPECPDCTITTLDQSPSINITKDGTYVDSNQDGITNVGDMITYNFVVKNTGNVTLTNVTITDNNAVITGGPIATLSVGATDSTTFTGSHAITQEEINAGLVYNLATVVAKDPKNNDVTDTSSDPTPCTSCPKDPECPDCTITTLEQSPSINVTKDGAYVDSNQDGITNIGDVVTYNFVVKNTGNVTLTNVTITDNNAVIAGGPIASLAVGATDSTTFTGSHTITQEDINAGIVYNLATVVAKDPKNNDVTDTSSDPTPCTSCPKDPECPDCTITTLEQSPSINITKDGTYVDSNQDGITNVGDVVTYIFAVKNTGNVTLTNVTITDNNAVVTGGPIASLAVGATDSTTFTGTHTITQEDINKGLVYNLATVVAKDPKDNPVTDTSSDPTPCTTCPKDPECQDCTITELNQTPGLTVVKTSTTASFSKVGDIINYTITVKNTGNVTLNQITVKDPLTGLDTLIAVLVPGATSEYTQSYTVTQVDLDKGSVTNVAKADGFTPNETPISATDDEIVNESANPIDAVDDNAGTIVGVNVSTPNVINVFTNDTLNGLAVNPADVILTTVTANPFLQMNADGSIDVLPDAPAGTQTMVYQICEKLNNTNCDTATVTVNIEAPSMTVNGESICINDVPYFSYTTSANNFTPLNGLTITWKDNNGNVVVTMNNLPLNGKVLWPGAIVDENGNGIDWPGWLLVNGKWIQGADGFENLRPNASLTLTMNPSETIVVNYPPSDPLCTSRPTFRIDAVDDNAGTIVGVNVTTPNVINVFKNDTLNTDPLNPADVTLTTVTANPFLQLNPDGSVDVLPNAPAGVQTMVYQICEKADTGNCDTATVTVNIETPTMTVTGQSICINDVPYFSYTTTANNFTPLNGLTLTWKDNNGNVVATMTNLPLNGKVLWPGAIVDNNGNGVDWPGWLLVNGKWIQGADGFENLRPTASITLTLNPDETIVVNYPPSDPLCTSRPTFKIDAVDDTAGPIDGINGVTNVLNVLKNDTLNTDPVNPADITLTLVTPDATGYMTMTPEGSINLKDGTPAGVYTLVYQICENADTGNCDTATVTVNVICNNTTKISGIVLNVGTNTPLANVPVTLIPQGTTPGSIRLQITNADGYYNFTGMVEGDYLVQVQDANLNAAFQLYPVNSSLFFTTLKNCVYQNHEFRYDKSDTPVLGDFVWYDVNNNGLQDEWYDANNDNLVTKNVPDANGNIDYSKWEWIDLNGDGSYKGQVNVGELNAAGFGNAKSDNIFVTGPNGYSDSVIIGIQGFWRNRPTVGLYGDYKIELRMDANLEAESSKLGATGLVKVLPNTSKNANSSKTGKSTSFEVCGPTNGNPQTTTLTANNPVNLDIDFGISCKMYADVVATPDVYNITNCTLDNVVRNALSNDLLNGAAANISDFNFKLLSPVVQHINIDATGNIVFENGIPAGQYVFNYQVCEKANPTNCTTSTITINVAPLATVTVTGSSYCNADTTLIDLNPSLPQGTPTTGTWINSDNVGSLNSNMLNAFGIPIGKYKFEYKIGGDCPRSIFLDISINDDCKVLPCKALVVHNALSANEDGKNDYFQIDNIEDNACYKNVRVEIYNRWGVLVFERDDYNNGGNAFRGKSEGRTTISKNEGLPTGTYFYILSYDTDGIKVKKDGYLYLVK